MQQVERARYSLRRRITFITLVIFLVGISALSYYVDTELREDMERVLADQQHSTVAYIATDFNTELEERMRILGDVAHRIEPSLLERPEELQRKIDAYPGLAMWFNSGVVVVRRDGTAIADTPKVEGRSGINYADNIGTMAALKEGKPMVGPPVIGRLLQQPLFNINVPIRDGRGEVIGAVFGVINLAKPNFLDRVVKRNYGKSGTFLVVDLKNDLYVAATDFSRAAQPLPEPGRNPVLDKRRKGFLGSEIATNSLGVEFLSSASPLPASGWLVVATLPTEEAFAPIREMRRRIANTTLLLALIAGAVSWWLLRAEFAPLSAASQALARMTEDTAPPQPLPVVHHDEIGQLVSGFNRLLGKLGENESRLKAERNFLSAVLQQASDGIALLEPADLRIRQVNPSLCHMLGREREHVLGTTFDELLGAEVLLPEHERSGSLVEIKRAGKDGASISLEVVTTRLCDENGVPHTILAIARDITARRQVEEEQRRFIAMVSHEFRTPLATIDAAVQRLEAGEVDPATSKRYRNIQNAVDRLIVLLDDYLTLGRLDAVGQGLHLSQCAPRALLLDSQAAAQSLSSEHDVTVDADALPESFLCDVDRMSLALHVLVDNAINYTPPGSAIELRGWRSVKGGIEISVADNGNGIPEDELPHVFDKFFRGRAAARQTGSGLGLHMARKVVAMHGGTITAGNRPEGGAEFTIWLPSRSHHYFAGS